MSVKAKPLLAEAESSKLQSNTADNAKFVTDSPFSAQPSVVYRDFVSLCRESRIQQAVIHDTDDGFYVQVALECGNKYFLQTQHGEVEGETRCFTVYETARNFMREHIGSAPLDVEFH